MALTLEILNRLKICYFKARAACAIMNIEARHLEMFSEGLQYLKTGEKGTAFAKH